MIRKCCEREGLDMVELEKQDPDEEAASRRDFFARMRRDPLVKLAEGYTHAALTLCEQLRVAHAFNTWPDAAKEALDTIEWYAMRVASKTFRAISGFEEDGGRNNCDESGGIDIQSDWNGSAKVARLEVAESRAAWEVILSVGGAPADSPLRGMTRLLGEIDAGLAARFPHAMHGVRAAGVRCCSVRRRR